MSDINVQCYKNINFHHKHISWQKKKLGEGRNS